MVLFISGATHTGKTRLAQKLLERYGWPYLSLDHLKMGLIRSGYTSLTVEDDDALTALMWPIVREMAKTATENGQNMIIEGCYLPYDLHRDFDETYRPHIRAVWIAMTEQYIRTHISDISGYASVVEERGDEVIDQNMLLRDNAKTIEMCRKYGCELILVEQTYDVELTIP